MTEAKEQIRAKIREQRRSLDPVWIRASSAVVVSRLFRLKEFVHSRVIASYIATPREVQTMDLIYACWDLKKIVCVPAWDGQRGAYEMSAFARGEELVAGPGGILQPLEPRWMNPKDIHFVVVPGMAFDRRGNRIGHGGGHFDRLLSTYSGFRAGVAFEFQITEEIPQGDHDIPVDVVVTEKHSYPREAASSL